MFIVLLDEPGLFVFRSPADAVRGIEPIDAESEIRAAFDDAAVPYTVEPRPRAGARPSATSDQGGRSAQAGWTRRRRQGAARRCQVCRKRRRKPAASEGARPAQPSKAARESHL